jgi:hypothetical protein
VEDPTGRRRGLQDRGGEERRCSAARHERYLSACAAEGREMRRPRAGGATNAILSHLVSTKGTHGRVSATKAIQPCDVVSIQL